MKDFLLFKRMLTPVIIYVFFWVLLAVCFVVGIWDIGVHDYRIGLSVLIIGPIALRVISEIMILFFRMNETITDINNNIIKGLK